MFSHVKDLPPGSFLYDREHAIITESVFDRLLEYSSTLPTGKSPGKVWKCNVTVANRVSGEPPHWIIRFITECYPPEPGKVLIHSREVLVIEGA